MTWLVLALFTAILMQLAQPLVENRYAGGDDRDDEAADRQRVLRSKLVGCGARDNVADGHCPHEGK